MVQGLVLTDHNRPLSFWQNVPVLGIVDQSVRTQSSVTLSQPSTDKHFASCSHEDRGINMTAQPRKLLVTKAANPTDLIMNLQV
jgi:hypothetical protein